MNDTEKMLNDEMELDKSYAIMFDTPQGKKVLKDLFYKCGVDSTAFVDDARRTIFNLGTQSVCHYIQQRIDGKQTERLKEQESNGIKNYKQGAEDA